MAMHQFQDRIAATLQRDMVMRHKGTALCTIVYQLITQQVGFQTADTIALNTFYGIQSLHQIQKALTRRLAKISNVHTRQHNFLATLTCSFLGLGYQRGDTGITAKAASIGNGAIGTEVVTPILDFQEIASTIAARATGRKSLDVLRLHREMLMR